MLVLRRGCKLFCRLASFTFQQMTPPRGHLDRAVVGEEKRLLFEMRERSLIASDFGCLPVDGGHVSNKVIDR
ncbi:hypothetical protein K9U40_23900, partial [Xanthobacter autotrophicus]|uniref:hypothetical protein n=1 Tax=Xanthobacter autotrophicus TaxID=280 RepID=UPI0024AABA8A